MNSRLVAGAALALGLLVGHGTALAEDIDLFVQPAGASGGTPNVLIVLDNTANWNTAFTNEIAALVRRSTTCPSMRTARARFRLGLMLFTETGGPNSNTDGGYMRAAIRDLTAANKTRFMNLLNSLSKQRRQVERRQGRQDDGGGLPVLRGPRALLRQWQGQDGLHRQHRRNRGVEWPSTRCPAMRSTPSTARPTTARSSDGSCGHNYIIYISNGAVQDNIVRHHDCDDPARGGRGRRRHFRRDHRDSDLAERLADPTSPTSGRGSCGRARSASSRTRSTSTRSRPARARAGPRCCGAWRASATASTSTSASGGGGAQIADALGAHLLRDPGGEQRVRLGQLAGQRQYAGYFLNQVYIGMFRPDADALPRWAGNLKQYKLGIVSGQLRTLDADDRQRDQFVDGVHHRMRAQLLDAVDGGHLLGVPSAGRLPGDRQFQRFQLSGRQHRREGRAGLPAARDDHAHWSRPAARPSRRARR